MRPQRDWLLLGWSQVWSCCLENREINLQTRRCNISTLTIRFPKQLLTQHDKRPAGYCSVIKSAIINCISNFLSDGTLSVVVVIKIYILLPSPYPVLGNHQILPLLSRVLSWTVKSNFSDDNISPSPVRLRRQRGQVWVWDRKMQLKHLSWPQESIRHRRWDLKKKG